MTPYTNYIGKVHYSVAFGLPFIILLIIIFGAVSAFADEPPIPEFSVSTNELPRVGAPHGVSWSQGVTNVLSLFHADHPEDVPLPKATGVFGGFVPKKPAVKPHYKLLCKNDLTGEWIEFRAYLPGNTAFFKTELVTE